MSWLQSFYLHLPCSRKGHKVDHIKHEMSLKMKAIKEIHNKHRDVKRGLNTRNEAKRNATIAAHVFLFASF